MSLVDNRVHLQDCENNNEVSGDTTAAPTAAVNDAGAVIQGTNSIAFQVADSQEFITMEDDSSGTLINVDMTDVTVYINVKHNLGETLANLGGQIVLGDGLAGAGGDIIGYNVNGNDVQGFPYLFRYTAIKLDVSVIVAVPGSNDVDYFQYIGTEGGLDHSAILQVGYGSFNVEKAISTGKNAWMDGIYYIANDSYAASILGGTEGSPETMVDVAADDIAVGAAMFNNPKGSEFGFFAPTEWGDAAGVTTTGFAGTDEQWYFIGDNQGGHAIGVTHFPFRVVGNSTGTNTFILTRVAITNTGTRAQFDLSSVDVDKLQLTGCVFTEFGVITMPANDADKFINDTVFNNCDQIALVGLDMDGCVFNGTIDADGAIIWDENTTDSANQDNATFNSDGGGNAIEVAPTGAGPFVYNIDGYTFDSFASQDGTAADRVFFINPSTLDADITINLTNSQATNPVGGGSDFFSHRDVGSYTGTLIIQQTVTLTVQVNDANGNGVAGARVRIEELGGTLVSQGTADGTGEYTDSFVFSSDLAVRIKTRLKGTKPFRTTSTITAAGMTVTATTTADTIVDLP